MAENRNILTRSRLIWCAIVAGLAMPFVPSSTTGGITAFVARAAEKTPEDECDERCGKGKVWDWHPCQCIDSDGETCKPEDMGCLRNVSCGRLATEIQKATKRRRSLSAYTSQIQQSLAAARSGRRRPNSDEQHRLLAMSRRLPLLQKRLKDTDAAISVLSGRQALCTTRGSAGKDRPPSQQ